MKNYLLNNNVGIEFCLFSIIHLIILIVTYLIIILILFNKKKISNISNKQKKKIRIIVGVLFLLIIIVRRGSFIYYGVYNWKMHLDLGFCNMANLLFVLYCFTGSSKIYNICYYFVFGGPLLAMLFPSVTVSINNFSFLAFIIMHYGLFLFNIIFAIFENKKYQVKEALIGISTGVIYFLITMIFNNVFNTAYNEFNSLISKSLQFNKFIVFLNKYRLICILLVLTIGSLMSYSGKYMLNYLNIGVEKNEKK